MTARVNKGKPTGQYIGQVEGGWTLYNIGDSRYKICAVEPLTGKANYTFVVTDKKIDKHGGLDAMKLKKERADVYDAVNAFLDGTDTTNFATDEADRFGDLALSRRRKLTNWQIFHRGILSMRRIELEHAAAQKKSVWDSAVRLLWAGIFKTKITDNEAARQVTYITKRAGAVNLELLLTAEQQFYTNKYAPHSCATLAAQLDTIAGEPEDTTTVGEPIDANIDDLLS